MGVGETGENDKFKNGQGKMSKIRDLVQVELVGIKLSTLVLSLNGHPSIIIFFKKNVIIQTAKKEDTTTIGLMDTKILT